MTLSKQTIPHYSYVDECDVTELVKLRQALKAPLASTVVAVVCCCLLLSVPAIRNLRRAA